MDPREWRTEKNRALLAILVGARGELFHQERLVEWLWPGPGSNRRGASLRKRISELRRILEPDLCSRAHSRYIVTAPCGYRFSDCTDCWVDVEEFSELCAEGERLERSGDLHAAADTFQAAVDLYGTGYLPDFRYAEWALPHRENWMLAYLDAIERLVECARHTGDHQRAIMACQRALRIDPLRESLLKPLMELYLQAGNRALARATYEKFARELDRLLGLPPGRELRDLYARTRESTHTPGTSAEPGTAELTAVWDGLPLVGRERERALIESRLHRAGQGHGGLLLVLGEPGVGKTRLVADVLGRAQAAGMLTLSGRCPEEDASRHEPLLEAIRAGLHMLSARQLNEMPEVARSFAWHLLPEMRNAVPRAPRMRYLPGRDGRTWKAQSIAQLLKGLGALGSFTSPILIVLDDLQNLSQTTGELLMDVSERLARSPVLIIGAVREGPRASLLLPLLRRAPSVDEILIGPLDMPSAHALLHRFLDPSHKGHVRALCKHTGGNPSLMIALLHALLAEAKAEMSPAGTLRLHSVDWQSLPRETAALVRQRIERLERVDRSVLRILAVLEKPAEPELLALLWSSNGELLENALERLLTARFVRLDERGRCYIPQAPVRQAVLGDLDDEKRRLLHWKAARALEALPATLWRNGTAADIAQHAFRSGDWQRTLRYSLQALRSAVREYRWDEVLFLADLGLGAADSLGTERTLTERFEILRARSSVLEQLGREQEHERDLKELQCLTDHLGDSACRGEVQEQWAEHLRRRGEWDSAIACAQKALALHTETGNRLGEARAKNLLGDLLCASGNPQGGRPHLECASLLFEDLAEEEGLAAAQNNLGLVSRRLGQHAAALAHFERALAVRDRLGDIRGRVQILANIGSVHWNLGRPLDAMDAYSRAAELLSSMGDKHGELKARFNTGIVLSDLGRYEEALASYGHALTLAREIRDRSSEGACLTDMGTVHAALGGYDEAERLLKEACGILEENSDRHRLGIALHNLARVHLCLGCPVEAKAGFEQAYALRSVQGDGRREASDLCGISDALHALGLADHALRSVHEALGIVERLEDPGPRLEVLWRLAEIELALGHKEQAERWAKEALQLLAAHGSGIVEQPQAAWYGCYRALGATGEEALAALHAAHDEIVKRAERIADPRLRSNYVDSIPLNRAVVEAWTSTRGTCYGD